MRTRFCADIRPRSSAMNSLSFISTNGNGRRNTAANFILLGKQTFGGFHKTHMEAMRAGIRMFGPISPFLVEQILEEEM